MKSLRNAIGDRAAAFSCACAIVLLASGCADPEGTYADVTAVAASGVPSQTVFNVTVASPDTGCEQYADWWEVVDEVTGALVTRRTLGHSHVGEQPFTRSGDAVDVGDTQRLVVRAHMNGAGFGGIEFRGSIATGFAAATESFESPAASSPAPPACAF